jgi:hypothetical protein
MITSDEIFFLRKVVYTTSFIEIAEFMCEYQTTDITLIQNNNVYSTLSRLEILHITKHTMFLLISKPTKRRIIYYNFLRQRENKI